jgi:hypothetical protein
LASKTGFGVKSDEGTGSDDERQAGVTPFFGNSESSKSRQAPVTIDESAALSPAGGLSTEV